MPRLDCTAVRLFVLAKGHMLQLLKHTVAEKTFDIKVPGHYGFLYGAARPRQMQMEETTKARALFRTHGFPKTEQPPYIGRLFWD